MRENQRTTSAAHNKIAARILQKMALPLELPNDTRQTPAAHPDFRLPQYHNFVVHVVPFREPTPAPTNPGKRKGGHLILKINLETATPSGKFRQR
ncbi:MAG: hypothetical protein NTY01_09245 [Verrucomicrobia bacterium]|nr:hypothetical protein [Verrucomicrobiota bacterium]